MYKVINGKRYNTETAQLISRVTVGTGMSWTDERLYRKRSGEYFLAGEGGAMSRYAKRTEDNTYTNGRDIVPVSIEQAKKWVESFDNGNYEKIFGEVSE